MRHPSRASMRRNFRRELAFDAIDSAFAPEHTSDAKANARAGALHGFVLALCILSVVIPILLITKGCASTLSVAEFSHPFLFLNHKPLMA